MLSVQRYSRERHLAKLDVSSVIFTPDSGEGGDENEREEEKDDEAEQSNEEQHVKEKKEAKDSLALATTMDVRAVVAEEVGSLRYTLEQVEHSAVQREQVRNASIAQAIASLDGGIRALRRVMETRNQLEGAAPFTLVSELEVMKEKLKQEEMEKAELELKLKIAEESFEAMKRGGERARREADEALHKGMLLRHQVASLEGRVARLDELTERLERAEKRNDELREMVVGEAREKEDLRNRAGDAERKVVRVENIVSLLRERLKSFVRPREEDGETDLGETDTEKEQRFLERRLRRSQSFGAGSLLYRELLGKDSEEKVGKEWPESPLDRNREEKRRRAQLEGLPPDGGFGGPDEFADGAGEQERIEKAGEELRSLPSTGVDTIFSFSRGEFDESNVPTKNVVQQKMETDTLLPELAERDKTDTSAGGPSPSSQEGIGQTKQRDANGLKSSLGEGIHKTPEGASTTSRADDMHEPSNSDVESTKLESEIKAVDEDDDRNRPKSDEASKNAELQRNDEKRDELKSGKEPGHDKERLGETKKRAVIRVIRRRSSSAINDDIQQSARENVNASQESKPTTRNPEEGPTLGTTTGFITRKDESRNDSQAPSTDSTCSRPESSIQGASQAQRQKADLRTKNLNESQSKNFPRDSESDSTGVAVPGTELENSDAMSRGGTPVTSAPSPTTELELKGSTQERVAEGTSNAQITTEDAGEEPRLNARESDFTPQSNTSTSSQHPEISNSKEVVGSSRYPSAKPLDILKENGSSENQKSYLEELEAQTAQSARSSTTVEESNIERSDMSASVDKPSREPLEHMTIQTESRATEREKVGTINELVDRANELVKRARQRGLAIPQSEALFKQAISDLESALELGDEHASVEAQMGTTLLSWARMNIANTEAQDRLVKALGYLSSSLEKRPDDELTICNTGLCLCLLASTSDAETAKGYYGRACGVYDELLLKNAESRIGSFNCGLAYVSLGRLELKEEDVDAEKCTKYFESAAKRFEKSLELKPGDGKAQSYLDDCRREITKLNERVEK